MVGQENTGREATLTLTKGPGGKKVKKAEAKKTSGRKESEKGQGRTNQLGNKMGGGGEGRGSEHIFTH